MDAILRGLTVYLFLLAAFRLAGNRTLSEATSFDLVLLLIISETTQQAMVDEDHSLTTAFLLIMTLIGASVAISALKHRFKTVRRWLEDTPVVIYEKGRLHPDRMDSMKVEKEDILEAARKQAGLERLEQVKYAVVEAGGGISIVPDGK
jgi:uncharacterized membrane protein YcaP (DUF421 family)